MKRGEQGRVHGADRRIPLGILRMILRTTRTLKSATKEPSKDEVASSVKEHPLRVFAQQLSADWWMGQCLYLLVGPYRSRDTLPAEFSSHDCENGQSKE